MRDILTQIVVWLSGVADFLGRWLLAPVRWLPVWLSATLIAAVTGVLMLVVFKYTSNQRAIKRVRDDISAELLTLKLFRESASVALLAQIKLVWGAARLFFHALTPMVVMALPAGLLLAQLAQWYQYRPLRVGDRALVIVKLSGDGDSVWPRVCLQPDKELQIVTGPVRVKKERWVCWDVQACANGSYRATFNVDGEIVEKELAIGDGYAPVSAVRPGRSWLDVLENPRESPLGPDSSVQSIEVDYPPRFTWKILGIEPWMAYWFVVSTVTALCFRRLLKVNI
jgi:hypothetical protein